MDAPILVGPCLVHGGLAEKHGEGRGQNLLKQHHGNAPRDQKLELVYNALVAIGVVLV